MEKANDDDDQLQTDSQKADCSEKITVPAKDRQYLQQNHKLQTVPQMAKVLNRANTTVYGYMAALGLAPKEREITRSHPFRRQNRKLETMFLGRRIQNGQQNRRQ